MEIVKMLADFGGIGLLAAVLFWMGERQRSTHAEERKEWKQVAERGQELMQDVVGLMASLKTLIEERIPHSDHELAVVHRLENEAISRLAERPSRVQSDH